MTTTETAEPQNSTIDLPSEAAVLALGFNDQRKFGFEFEFYSRSHERHQMADLLAQEAGIECHSEHYNHHDNGYWKIVTDASLGYDDENTEYDCDDCNVNHECDHECEGNCTPTYSCSDCDVPSDLRQLCSGEHEGQVDFCEGHNEHPTYDCDDCDLDRYCDEDCRGNHDSKSQDNHPMELVSPPLSGYQGLQTLARVLEVINQRSDSFVTQQCGLHVHHDARRLDINTFKTLAKLYIKYEPTLDELLPLSRRGTECCHCRSLRCFTYNSTTPAPTNQSQRLDRIGRTRDKNELCYLWYDRYLKLNLSSHSLHGTIEFRHHSGTLKLEKTLHWLVLTQKMLARAMTHHPVLIVNDDEHYVPPFYDMMRCLGASAPLRDFWWQRREQFLEEAREQDELRRQVEAERVRQQALHEEQQRERAAAAERDREARIARDAAMRQARWLAEWELRCCREPRLDDLLPTNYSAHFYTHRLPQTVHDMQQREEAYPF